MIEDEDSLGLLRRVDALIGQVEASDDRAAVAGARALVRAVLDLHREGLSRMLERLGDAGEPGRAVLAEFVEDRPIASLLLLHGIHPHDLETRVRDALDSVRPGLNRRGIGVELVAVADDAIRLRLRGGCAGGPAFGEDDRLAVEAAVCERAPEVTTIEVEGMAKRADAPANGLVILSSPDPREEGGCRRRNPGTRVS